MSKADAWKNWEGRTVDGKFPLRQWLGSSEHSAVFLTEKPGPGSTKAAIKLVESNGSDPEREAARLRQAATLSHPHLMQIMASGRCKVDGAPFVYSVMEFADEDLSQILPQRALTPSEVGDLLPPLLDALSYLHDKGLVHGHIKPSNVLAVQDQLKLSADQITSENDTNAARRRMGVFDAPETAAGVVSPAADVWSLGVTIVDALTQNLPAEGQTSTGVARNIPEPFRGIVRECLHLDPKMRCSVEEIRARLQPAARSVAAEETETPQAEKSGNGRTIGIAAVVIVAAALAVWGLLPKKKPGATPAETAEQTSSQTASQAPPQSSAPATTQTPSQTAPAVVQTPKPAAAQPKAGHGRSASATTTAGAGGAVRHQVMPELPQSARNTISGTIKIVVRAEVDASGKVTSARLKSGGPSRYFANRTLQAAQGWEFTPPEVNGQPVASTWLIQFRLRRGSTQASPERLTR